MPNPQIRRRPEGRQVRWVAGLLRRAPCVEFHASNARARLTGAIPRLRRGGTLREDARTEFAACVDRRDSVSTGN